MKICIVSDSHGHVDWLEEVVARHRECDLFMHAGDHAEDVTDLSGYKFVKVSGNCDLPTDAPSEQLIEAEGIRLLMTHGHHYRVKESLLPLQYRGIEVGADIVVFGHSHVPVLAEEAGILFINPGSLSYPRGGFAHTSYAVMELEKQDAGTNASIQFYTGQGESMPAFQYKKTFRKP